MDLIPLSLKTKLLGRRPGVTIRKLVSAINLASTPAQRRRFRVLSKQDEDRLRDCIVENFDLEKGNAENDLEEHLYGRLQRDRMEMIPWLASTMPLDGLRTLEIGAGTGVSTVALAEQGAIVTGVDVDERSLIAARMRCALYCLPATFTAMNASELGNRFAEHSFDFVIFFASFEHMTLHERLKSLSAAWRILKPNGFLAIVETPNRLWFYDSHTSFLPFFHWLPDDLAMLWAGTSPRISFARSTLDPVSLARWGRGASFHELELILGKEVHSFVVSNKTDFIRRHNPMLLGHSLVTNTRRYERFLERAFPQVNRAFFRSYLDVMIRKPADEK
jgi:2-polyprenyl-3-methyl-5-hydroxy-6-metoxy-1,4-benzoquinol methylase